MRKSISPLASTLPSHLYVPSSLLLMLRICRLLLDNTANRSGKWAEREGIILVIEGRIQCVKLLKVKIWHLSYAIKLFINKFKFKSKMQFHDFNCSTPQFLATPLFSKMHSRPYFPIKSLGYYFPPWNLECNNNTIKNIAEIRCGQN